MMIKMQVPSALNDSPKQKRSGHCCAGSHSPGSVHGATPCFAAAVQETHASTTHLQPRAQPAVWQPHAFFSADQPASQWAKPSAQLYGSGGRGGRVGAAKGQPLWCTLQHHFFFGTGQASSKPRAQLK